MNRRIFVFIKAIHSALLIQMIHMGAQSLSNHKEHINKLNVFPVPDGDTGTNMNLSMQSGVKALQQAETEETSDILKVYVKGLLMGARGNSGVILSQLFRGFSDRLENQTEITATHFADALESGVETAYAAVTNPVEGTILTVAKDAAAKAKVVAATTDNLIVVMEAVIAEAEASLDRTPDLLPILKEVGVVDSGGKGLLVIYQGFLAALKGEEAIEVNEELTMNEQIEIEHDKAVQTFVDVSSIEFGYCTEFFVELDTAQQTEAPFDEDKFRNQLSEYGDSLLVAATDDVVKIHIHTEEPGKVMSLAQQYGELNKIDIENMRKQYDAIVEEATLGVEAEKEVAVITVALGSGLRDLMKSIGATTIIEGGQTMNPSTEDILQAIKQTNAKLTYVLPNNKNILMAAKQAEQLAEHSVVVLPAKTIPQGIAALFAFDADANQDENTANMQGAMDDVKTGLVTYATRDTVINGIEIQKNNYIAMNDDTIVATHADKEKAVEALLQQITDEDDEIITVFFGEDITEAEKTSLQQFAETEMTNFDMEYHVGNQPLYAYMLMVE